MIRTNLLSTRLIEYTKVVAAIKVATVVVLRAGPEGILRDSF
jgi:hypothetical protein